MRIKNAQRICQYCHKEFKTFQSEINKGKAKYCSISCGVSVKNKLNLLPTHEIFFRNISKGIHPNGCWVYSKGKRYAKICVNGKTISVHRYSYELYKGQIPDNMVVCHKCDNKLCVNPGHLFIGTQKDNIQDMLSKKRGNHAKGSKHHRTTLTEKQIAHIKKRIISGEKIHNLKDEYNVSREMLYQMKAGRSWNHVEPEEDPT